MSKFCIVIPNYNDLKNLKVAVDSCLDQDFDDFTVAITDNNSDDGSVEYLNKICSVNPKVKSYINSNSLGKTDNWNQAFTNADDCDFLINLHSDDFLHPNALKYIDDALSTNTVLIHGANYQVTPGGKVLKRKHFPFNYSNNGLAHKALMITNNSVGIVGTAFKQDIFHELDGFSNEYNLFNDVDLWYRISDYGDCKYVSKIFGSYRQKFNVDPKPFFIERNKWYQSIYQSEIEDLSAIAIKTLIYKINKNYQQVLAFNDNEINLAVSEIKSYHGRKFFFNPDLYHLFLKLKSIDYN